MTAPGRKVPERSLVTGLVRGAEPRASEGRLVLACSMPALLRRQGGAGDEARTYRSPWRLRVARALV